MLLTFGFAWLLYYTIHNALGEYLNTESITDTLGSGGQFIRDYLEGSNNLQSDFTNIARGFNQIFMNIHPLFVHFIIVSLVLTIAFMFLKIIYGIVR